MTRPFRFALSINRLPASRENWRDSVLRAESGGFATVALGDHIGEERYASIAAHAHASAFGSKIRFGTFVFNNDFRHPALLAKEVATLDVMTGGRYEFGLGGGWMNADYDSIHMHKDPGPVRSERLGEALTIIKALFGVGKVDFQGTHYQISGLEGWPKPIQKPHPPILVGGGSRQILTLAAREADIVSLNPVHRKGARGTGPEIAADAVRERAEWVREAAGDRYPALEIHIRLTNIVVTDDSRRAAAEVGSKVNLSAEETLGSPYVAIGSHDQIIEHLHDLRELYGISYFSVHDADFDAMTPIISKVAGT